MTTSRYFRAIVTDFDGTLAEGERPADEVLQAIAETRRVGQRVLLATGRILGELEEVFADAREHFDAIVAENGAVVWSSTGTRPLVPAVELELDEALLRRDVAFRRGEVLLATHAKHELAIGEEIRNLELECQLVRNRGELMVLPAGVSKGLGVFHALGDLGISHHSAIGVGDAENDHSLLRICELGAAVANAVDALKSRADIVLDGPVGEGVVSLLRGPIVSGNARLEPKRWRVAIGRYDDGTAATLPASQINVLVTGGSKSGKSYLGGVLAERLIALGYCVCLLDPEGDYAPLGSLRGVLSLGGRENLPPAHQIPRFLEFRFGSLVIDMSLLPSERKVLYMQDALRQLERQRWANGLPHWVLVDEAHASLGEAGSEEMDSCDLSNKGYCLVTYRPEEMRSSDWNEMDVILALPEMSGARGAADPLAVVGRRLQTNVSGLFQGSGPGRAVLLRRSLPERGRVFEMGRRLSGHVRHWHKYTRGTLVEPLRFYFHGGRQGHERVARNIQEFHHILSSCDSGVVAHHARRLDFSRWVRDVIQDDGLAETMRRGERALAEGGDVDGARKLLLEAVEGRYLR